MRCPLFAIMKTRIDRVFHQLIQTDTIIYFLAINILTFLILFAKKSLIENETIAFQILQEEGRFGIYSIFNSLQFLAIPIIYLYKSTIIGFILWIGAFMFGYKITYKQCWKIALIGETVFLLPEIIKVFWFILRPDDVNIWQIRAFYPLSIMNFFDYQTLPAQYHYPLKALNVFEVIYWFVLVELVHSTASKQRSYAVAIVFLSYVPLFWLWLVYYILVYK